MLENGYKREIWLTRNCENISESRTDEIGNQNGQELVWVGI